MGGTPLQLLVIMESRTLAQLVEDVGEAPQVREAFLYIHAFVIIADFYALERQELRLELRR